MESSYRSILEGYDSGDYRSVTCGYLNPDIQRAFARFVRTIIDRTYGPLEKVTFIYYGRSGLILAAACCGHNPDRSYMLAKEDSYGGLGNNRKIIFVDDHIESGKTFEAACMTFSTIPKQAISITGYYDPEVFTETEVLTLGTANV